MGNFWLDQIELEETADALVEFITQRVSGKKLQDPKSELRACVVAFFTNNPDRRKFQHRMDFEMTIQATPKGDGYWVTHVKVICQ